MPEDRAHLHPPVGDVDAGGDAQLIRDVPRGRAAQKEVMPVEEEAAGPDDEAQEQLLEHRHRGDRDALFAPLVLEAELLEARLGVDGTGEVWILRRGAIDEQAERVVGSER